MRGKVLWSHCWRFNIPDPPDSAGLRSEFVPKMSATIQNVLIDPLDLMLPLLISLLVLAL